jgi:hypothetical protein
MPTHKKAGKPDESMMPSSMVEELAFQYDNLFHVLRVTIHRISLKQWVEGADPFRTPVRQACHILESCEYYATGEGGGCRRRFGCLAGSLDGEIPAEQLPNPAQVVDYLLDVEQKVKAWLGGIREEDLLGRCPNWGWRERGLTLLGHILYVLRHATFHIGHLHAELHSRKIKGGVFR